MTHPFFETFEQQPTILPVIHITDSLEQTLENIRIAKGEGADGLFLIDHHQPYRPAHLWEHYGEARQQQAYIWIGLNFLSQDPEKLFCNLPKSLDGIWTDDIGIYSPESDASSILDKQRSSQFDGLHFAGFAFKYRTQVLAEQLSATAARAIEFLDPGVLTTSGDSTGTPPSVEKIEAIRKGIGASPLAIASGISWKNIAKYVGLAQAFLVASSITNEDEKLNAERLCLLMRAAGR